MALETSPNDLDILKFQDENLGEDSHEGETKIPIKRTSNIAKDFGVAQPTDIMDMFPQEGVDVHVKPITEEQKRKIRELRERSSGGGRDFLRSSLGEEEASALKDFGESLGEKDKEEVPNIDLNLNANNPSSVGSQETTESQEANQEREESNPRGDFKTKVENVISFLKGVGNNIKLKVLAYDLSGHEKPEDKEKVLSIIEKAEKEGVINEKLKSKIVEELDIEPVQEAVLTTEDSPSLSQEVPTVESQDSEPKDIVGKDESKKTVINSFDKEKSLEDDSLVSSIKDIYNSGDTTKAIALSSSVQDIEKQANLIGDLVENCIKSKNYDLARQFISRVHDSKYKLELTKWATEIEMGEVAKSKKKETQKKPKEEIKKEVEPAPEVTSELVEGELVTPDNSFPKIERDVIDGEIIDETPDLDLNHGLERVDVSDVDLQKTENSLDENLVLGNGKLEESPMAESLKPFGPMTKAETERADKVEADLLEKRKEYERLYVEWEAKTREKKNFLSRALFDLGINKPRMHENALSIKTSELEDAKSDYLKLLSQRREILNGDREMMFDFILGERELLDKEMNSLRPEKEKTRIRKATEDLWSKWAKRPAIQRIAIPTALLAGGGVAFGTLGAASALGYAGLRVGRAGLNILGVQATGIGIDKITKTYNKKKENEAISQYLDNTVENNLEDKEKELDEFFDKQAYAKKKQKILKTTAMVGAGMGTYLMTGVGQEHLAPSAPTSSGFFSGFKHFFGLDNPPAKIDLPNIPDSPKISGESLPDALKVPKAPDILDTNIELSSKGFLQDIHSIKSKIIEQYGDESMVPKELKANILDKTDVALAKELHLYDPDQNLSAVGLKGESLGLEDGKLVYHRLNGEADILLDTKSGNINQFDGPMKNFGQEEALPESQPEALTERPSANPPTEDKVEEVVEKTVPSEKPEVVSASPLSAERIPYGDSFVEITNNGEANVMKWNGVEIAHEHYFNHGKIISLDDQFQEGPFSEIKKAFNTAFEKSVNIDSIAKVSKTIPFEDGQIKVFQGLGDNPNEVSVLLNGREIAKGVLGDVNSKIEVFPGLKHGRVMSWIMSDSVYERAFKVAKSTIKTLKPLK